MDDLRTTLAAEREDKKKLQRALIDEFIKSGDVSDPDILTKVMGAVNESKPSTMQIAQEQSQEKRLAWGGADNQSDEELTTNSKESDKEWV
ncbi:hypothetical protein ACI2OX_04735 [Bacillus sp. N9]